MENDLNYQPMNTTLADLYTACETCDSTRVLELISSLGPNSDSALVAHVGLIDVQLSLLHIFSNEASKVDKFIDKVDKSASQTAQGHLDELQEELNEYIKSFEAKFDEDTSKASAGANNASDNVCSMLISDEATKVIAALAEPSVRSEEWLSSVSEDIKSSTLEGYYMINVAIEQYMGSEKQHEDWLMLLDEAKDQLRINRDDLARGVAGLALAPKAVS
jgi:hypothetical protein